VSQNAEVWRKRSDKPWPCWWAVPRSVFPHFENRGAKNELGNEFGNEHDDGV